MEITGHKVDRRKEEIISCKPESTDWNNFLIAAFYKVCFWNKNVITGQAPKFGSNDRCYHAVIINLNLNDFSLPPIFLADRTMLITMN